MSYMLTILMKFRFVPQSFCQNQSRVQDQDQDQHYDFTFDFSTRTKFHRQKIPTKFFLDVLTSKIIVHPDATHRRTDRQTDGFFLLVSKTYKTWTFIRRTFFFNHEKTPAVCYQKVKISKVIFESRCAKNKAKFAQSNTHRVDSLELYARKQFVSPQFSL